MVITSTGASHRCSGLSVEATVASKIFIVGNEIDKEGMGGGAEQEHN
jgi:hypothetical protein